MTATVDLPVQAVKEPHEPEHPPSGPVLRVLRAVDKVLLRIEEGLIIAMTVFMVSMVMLQVIGRLAGWTIPWAMEASVFAMLGMSLVAGSITTHYRRHIAIDVLSRIMPAPVRTFAAVVIDAVAIVLLVYLVRVSVFFVSVNREWAVESTAMKIPFWYIQALIPVALAIIAFRFFISLLEDLKRIRTRQWLSADAHHHGVDMRT